MPRAIEYLSDGGTRTYNRPATKDDLLKSIDDLQGRLEDFIFLVNDLASDIEDLREEMHTMPDKEEGIVYVHVKTAK